MNLQTALSKYDLLGALPSHFPIDIQQAVISANLKSKQDALAFLGNLQAMEVSKDTYRNSTLGTTSNGKLENKIMSGDAEGGVTYSTTERKACQTHTLSKYQQVVIETETKLPIPGSE